MKVFSDKSSKQEVSQLSLGPLGIIYLDSDFCLIDLDTRALVLLDLPMDPTPGCHVLSLFPEEEKPGLQSLIFAEESSRCQLVKVSKRRILSCSMGHIGSGEDRKPLVILQDVTRFITEITREKEAGEQTRRLNRELEARLEVRTRELADAQKQLIQQAQQAGMAEIASSVLHNVGNLMTSLITSTEMTQARLSERSLEPLHRANRLQGQLLADICENTPKLKALVDYYRCIETRLIGEREDFRDNMQRIRDKSEAVREVIEAMQSYNRAHTAGPTRLHEVVEDALTLQAEAMAGEGILIKRRFDPAPEVILHRPHAIQVIFQLLKNAREALEPMPEDRKEIELLIVKDKTGVRLEVHDKGPGIDPENLADIFSLGYTTKEGFHGYGLHECADAMNRMGGSIRAQSEGPGKGAVFILYFQVAEPEGLEPM
ncbi:MAG: ATP-binding protein [Acidobacteriota bacterium]|nr:ATP-binding protein [Acidobacteriota bacterium]